MKWCCDQRVGPELLAQTADWSDDHFHELNRRSPEAHVHLTMALRDNNRAKARAIELLLGDAC
jgi:hypothetical protein